MKCSCNCCFTYYFSSSSCRCYYYTSNWSKLLHCILWPIRRRQPCSLPTSLLILWPPRSLHSHSPWLWYCVPYYFRLQLQERNLWLLWNSLCYSFNWPTWFHCLSPSYIYRWYRRRHPSLLHSSNNNHCSSNRCKNLFLISNSLWI